MASETIYPKTSGLSTCPQEGLWRVTALMRWRRGATGSGAELESAVAEALDGEDRLVRFVVDRIPADLDPAIRGMFPPLFDAMFEFWFASRDDAVAVMMGLGSAAAISTAAEALVDRGTSVLWLAQVFPVKPERGASRVKFLAGGDAADGWSIEDAQVYWRDVHPVVAQTAPSVWLPLTRYVQFHGSPLPDGLVDSPLGIWRRVPMCAEMGFADVRDFVTNYSNDEYLAIVRPDEEKFSRPGEALAFVSGEERIVLART